jgi:lipoate synthase
MKVDRYVEPSEFERWKEVAEGMGFLYVASGPLVRSSYKVDIHFLRRSANLVLLIVPFPVRLANIS